MTAQTREEIEEEWERAGEAAHAAFDRAIDAAESEYGAQVEPIRRKQEEAFARARAVFNRAVEMAVFSRDRKLAELGEGA